MESKSMKEHKKHSPMKVKVGIITLSDSISNQNYSINKDIPPNEDLSGKIILESLKREHEIVSYKVIPDDAELLLINLEKMNDKGAQIIISTGGTGIGKRDITIETITPLFTKELKGLERYSVTNHIKNWELVQYYQGQLQESGKKLYWWHYLVLPMQ